jgi:hypothetical protein
MRRAELTSTDSHAFGNGNGNGIGSEVNQVMPASRATLAPRGVGDAS